jgi:hypothetical protein
MYSIQGGSGLGLDLSESGKGRTQKDLTKRDANADSDS